MPDLLSFFGKAPEDFAIFSGQFSTWSWLFYRFSLLEVSLSSAIALDHDTLRATGLVIPGRRRWDMGVHGV